ncbi:hypothetical protein [uncultured Megamonas sp.]|uniref:hypothetical protein n=1 Tax=uncultured Megamonas sp. TaxID=286140 RepID=UPI0025F0BF7C|nr:hypothetical protein [uncultured Megamonas sp.]
MNLKVITREKYVLDDNVFNGFFENVFNLTAIEYTLKSILKNKDVTDKTKEKALHLILKNLHDVNVDLLNDFKKIVPCNKTRNE